MTKIDFYKFHGAGNDFIIIDNRDKAVSAKVLTAAEIAALCHRRFGIGADGLILLDPAAPGTDFSMHYFNADGFEGSLCGNGGRCIVAFAHFLKIIGESCVFEAYDGKHKAHIDSFGNKEWVVSLQMKDVAEITGHEEGYFVDTGSPHFVMFVDDVEKIDVPDSGRKYRHDSRFVQGTNVNFASRYQNGIFVRTYERGVEDETLSCGTGITASALLWAIFQDFQDGAYKIPVYAKGGNFTVSFVKKGRTYSGIFLTGPVKLSFMGEVWL